MNATEQTETKHTPGPWKVFYTTTGQTILGIGEADGAEGITDAQFGLWRDGAEREANARLIAAAPELFELVKLFERTIEYEIRKSSLAGDDEGARMKAVTLGMVREVLAKASS